jgi:hypothetical protein
MSELKQSCELLLTPFQMSVDDDTSTARLIWNHNSYGGGTMLYSVIHAPKTATAEQKDTLIEHSKAQLIGQLKEMRDTLNGLNLDDSRIKVSE